MLPRRWVQHTEALTVNRSPFVECASVTCQAIVTGCSTHYVRTTYLSAMLRSK